MKKMTYLLLLLMNASVLSTDAFAKCDKSSTGGNDTIECDGNNDTVNAGGGDDRVTGGGGR